MSEAESKPVALTSVVHRVADQLREAILLLEEGTFLGSEETLSTRLGVSAPTLRQAGRLLEHEQLLRIKRGISGGYFSRRPELAAVTHIAAILLRSHHAKITDFDQLMNVLSPLIIELAAPCKRPDLLEELRTFATQSVAEASKSDLGTTERRFLELLGEMSDNIPLKLIIAIFNNHGMLRPKPAAGYDKKITARLIKLRAEQAAAVLEGDTATALKVLRQRLELRRLLRSNEPAPSET